MWNQGQCLWHLTLDSSGSPSLRLRLINNQPSHLPSSLAYTFSSDSDHIFRNQSNILHFPIGWRWRELLHPICSIGLKRDLTEWRNREIRVIVFGRMDPFEQEWQHFNRIGRIRQQHVHIRNHPQQQCIPYLHISNILRHHHHHPPKSSDPHRNPTIPQILIPIGAMGLGILVQYAPVCYDGAVRVRFGRNPNKHPSIRGYLLLVGELPTLST